MGDQVARDGVEQPALFGVTAFVRAVCRVTRRVQQRLHALFPGIDEEFCLPFRYPPFVALLAAPLAALPYAFSYALFVLISAVAWFAALRCLASEVTFLQGPWRRTVWLAAAGWPVVLETLIGGQASLLALLIA